MRKGLVWRLGPSLILQGQAVLMLLSKEVWFVDVQVFGPWHEMRIHEEMICVAKDTAAH
jgi:hypothetical protein